MSDSNSDSSPRPSLPLAALPPADPIPAATSIDADPDADPDSLPSFESEIVDLEESNSDPASEKSESPAAAISTIPATIFDDLADRRQQEAEEALEPEDPEEGEKALLNDLDVEFGAESVVGAAAGATTTTAGASTVGFRVVAEDEWPLQLVMSEDDDDDDDEADPPRRRPSSSMEKSVGVVGSLSPRVISGDQLFRLDEFVDDELAASLDFDDVPVQTEMIEADDAEGESDELPSSSSIIDRSRRMRMWAEANLMGSPEGEGRGGDRRGRLRRNRDRGRRGRRGRRRRGPSADLLQRLSKKTYSPTPQDQLRRQRQDEFASRTRPLADPSSPFSSQSHSARPRSRRAAGSPSFSFEAEARQSIERLEWLIEEWSDVLVRVLIGGQFWGSVRTFRSLLMDTRDVKFRRLLESEEEVEEEEEEEEEEAGEVDEAEDEAGRRPEKKRTRRRRIVVLEIELQEQPQVMKNLACAALYSLDELRLNHMLLSGREDLFLHYEKSRRMEEAKTAREGLLPLGDDANARRKTKKRPVKVGDEVLTEKDKLTILRAQLDLYDTFRSLGLASAMFVTSLRLLDNVFRAKLDSYFHVLASSLRRFEKGHVARTTSLPSDLYFAKEGRRLQREQKHRSLGSSPKMEASVTWCIMQHLQSKIPRISIRKDYVRFLERCGVYSELMFSRRRRPIDAPGLLRHRDYNSDRVRLVGSDGKLPGTFRDLALKKMCFLFETRRFANVTLRAEEGTSLQLAHREILVFRSHFFHSMLKGGWAEAKQSESSIVVIENMSDEELLHLLEFSYTGKVRCAKIEVLLSLLSHASMYFEEVLRSYLMKKLCSILKIVDSANNFEVVMQKNVDGFLLLPEEARQSLFSAVSRTVGVPQEKIVNLLDYAGQVRQELFDMMSERDELQKTVDGLRSMIAKKQRTISSLRRGSVKGEVEEAGEAEEEGEEEGGEVEDCDGPEREEMGET